MIINLRGAVSEQITRTNTNPLIINKRAVYISSEPNYLRFASNNVAFTIALNASGTTGVTDIQYRIDNGNWIAYTLGTQLSASNGSKIYFKGTNSGFSTSSSYASFSSTGNPICSGNVMSLLDETCQSVTIPTAYCFRNLFYNSGAAFGNLLLPATTLTENCYQQMFRGCSDMLTAPLLPATTVPASAYRAMFQACSSLTSAPSISATSVNENSCYRMFYGCSDLATPPALKATTLGNNCYYQMFYNCGSLNVYSSSGTGHDVAWRIPASGSAESYTIQTQMFYGTTGSFSTNTNIYLNNRFYTTNTPV